MSFATMFGHTFVTKFCILLVYTYICNMTPNKMANITDFVPDDFYQRRVSHFASLEVRRENIVMLGDSLINGCEWHELLQDARILNRGINSDTIEGVRQRMGNIVSGKPQKVFVMVGINDVSHHIEATEIACHIVALADEIHQQSPSTQVYIHSLLPFDASIHYSTLMGKEDDVIEINRLLQQASKGENYVFIDLYSYMTDSTGKILDSRYTNDGLHLNGNGYNLWAKVIEPYINTEKR